MEPGLLIFKITKSMKAFRMKWMVTFFVAAVGLNFSSCSDDDDLEQTNITSNADPEGTIVVNMNNDGSAVSIQMDKYTYTYRNWEDKVVSETANPYVDLEIDKVNNFRVRRTYWGDVDIVSVGQVSGLGKVNSIPTAGWSDKTAVIPKCGYIIRHQQKLGENYTPRKIVQYARVYVVDYIEGVSGGIIGAVIKYQGDWKSEDIN